MEARTVAENRRPPRCARWYYYPRRCRAVDLRQSRVRRTWSGSRPSCLPCRHVAAFGPHPPPRRRESRSQTWLVHQTQRGVRERVGPTGHHDLPGNLACSEPCPPTRPRCSELRSNAPAAMMRLLACSRQEAHRTVQPKGTPRLSIRLPILVSPTQRCALTTPLQFDAHASGISADQPRRDSLLWIAIYRFIPTLTATPH